MKTGQGNGDALKWSGISEISNEAKSLSALLPDAGRSSKTQLARVDAVRPIRRIRGLIASPCEMSDQAPVRGNPFPSLAE